MNIFQVIDSYQYEMESKYQEKSIKKIYITSPQSKSEESFESNAFNSSEEVKTNVVFLPRDPEWAFVFWQISDAD